MSSAEDLEKILIQLSVPDNRAIEQATLQLKTAFANPDIASALIKVLSESTIPTVRQYAAILLRRRIVKHWKKLSFDVRHGLKLSLLQMLGSETEHLVRKACCQVISSIAKQELKGNGWPDVLQYITEAVKSENKKQKEAGYLLLSCICEAGGELLRPFYGELYPICKKGLADSTNRKLAFYSIKALTSVVPYFGSDEAALVMKIIPKIMEVVKELLQTNEEMASEALDFFDELVDLEVGFFTPHAYSLVALCLQIAQSEDFSDAFRVKALYLVCWACRRKAKALSKSELLQPLLEILLSLMSLNEKPDADICEDEMDEVDEVETEIDENTLPSVAAQALDLLALHLSPKIFIPTVMKMVKNYLGSSDCYRRKASYIAFGVMSEGCADYIKHSHLQEALKIVSDGISDESKLVSNAALFTLGQYAQHFQPEINKFHTEIIPVLLGHLQNTINTHNAKQKTTLTRIYYALDSLCENLEKNEVLPHIEQLVRTFLGTITSSKGTYATELALSAIGSLANSAKDALLPYFPGLMEHLKVFLKEPATLETSSLQAQAVDTLGSIARNIGAENFKYVTHDCMQLGFNLLENSDDPDIRRCTYALFASLSTVLRNDMEQYLQKIIPKMLESLRSTEGVVAQFSEEEPAFLLDDDLDEEDIADGDDEDDDEDVEGYTMENAYIDEKEDTCNALSEISEQTGSAFLPYIEECFKEVFFIVDDSHVNLRKASITSCANFCKVLQNILQENGATDFTPADKLREKTIPVAVEIIKKETDRNTVMAAVDSINEILKSMKIVRLQNQEFIQSIANAVNELIMERTPCQGYCGDDDDDDYDDDVINEDQDGSVAELDSLLLEKSHDVLPSLAQAIGGEAFKPILNLILPKMLKLARRSQFESPPFDRSLAVGTLTDIIQAMEHHVSEFVPQLHSSFILNAGSFEDDIACDSVFALGVLAENGREATLPFYEQTFAVFDCLLKKDEWPYKKSILFRDNVCGAVARMIMANLNAVPLDQIIPVILQLLPIKEDKEENETVMKCFVSLYEIGNKYVITNTGKLLPHLLQSLLDPESGLTKETRRAVKLLLVDVQRKFPEDFVATLIILGVPDNILETITL